MLFDFRIRPPFKSFLTTGGMFGGVTEVDDDFFDELEERLILADMGV